MRFQDRRFQPLTHSSVSKYNVQLLLAGILVTTLSPVAAFWCTVSRNCHKSLRVSPRHLAWNLGLDGRSAWLAAGGSIAGFSAGAGLGIGVVSYAAVKIWRKYKEHTSSPYNYLNKIAAVHAKNHTLLSLPPAF